MPTKKRAVKKVLHPFMKERDIKEGFVIIRIDDYNSSRNERKAFSSNTAYDRYGSIKGMLWDNYADAERAAIWVAKKEENKTKIYAVMKIIAIVEREKAQIPIEVTKV